MRLAPFPAIALCAGLAWPGAVDAADMQRGRVLYESSCAGCHAASVHGREKREARDFEAVRAWVIRWSANLRLKWSEDEVTDVAAHLNAAYYGFRCPPAYCTVTGEGARKGARVAQDGVSR
jgi:mono/diheme cytochrome c family protein